MKNILWLLVFGVIASVGQGDTGLQVAGNLALRHGFGMNKLMKRADMIHRLRRQVGRLGPRDPVQCVLDCAETMEEKLKEAFPQVTGNIKKGAGVTDPILDSEFDPEKFEQFCNIYTPSARCANLCPESDVKQQILKAWAMFDFMCVDRYADFKKYGKCFNDAGKQVNEICVPKCSEFESGIEKLENVTTDASSEENSPGVADIRDVLNQTCNLVACLITCEQPITLEKCGKEAADLEQQAIQISFGSVGDLLKDVDPSMWPASCQKLGVNPESSPSNPVFTKPGDLVDGNPKEDITLAEGAATDDSKDD